jgi:phage tail-like protein
MADEISRPRPAFSFSVHLGDDEDVTFQEATGLQREAKVIEYRHGNSPDFSPTRLPGLSSESSVTLKKGILSKNTRFFDWYQKTKTGESITRRIVVINLVDEGGKTMMTWTLNNAWPRKVAGADFKSDGDQVTVDSIEIAYETLEVKAT